MGYKQELNRTLERVPELRDLVHDHLGPRRLLHDLLPGVEQRRPGRDLVGLADHLAVHPHHRLLHGRARLGLSDGGRDLLVGLEARRPGLGLVHRLVQPARPDRDPRVGRLLRRPVPRQRSSASTTSTSSASTSATAWTRCARRSCCSSLLLCAARRSSTSAAAISSRCSTASRSSGTSLGVAVIVGILDLRAVRPRELRLRLHRRRRTTRGFGHGMFWWYVLPLGFLLTQYTITGFDASAHISEETHDAAMSAPQRRLAVGLLLGGHRLHRAAGDHLRHQRTRTRSTRAAAPFRRLRQRDDARPG